MRQRCSTCSPPFWEWNDLTLSTPAAVCISAKDQEALQSLKHFLLQNYSAQVDLQRLAQMCYMSKSKLTYLFRMLYGTTIYEYILTCRIDRAKELLADRGKKISEIAALVGYERQSSFSAAFHQKTASHPMSSAANSGVSKTEYHLEARRDCGVLFLKSAKSVSECSRLWLKRLRFLQTDSIIWLVDANL